MMQCMIIVVVPTVSPDKLLETYGTEDIGEVPRLDFMEKATPKAMMAKPSSAMALCFSICCMCIILLSC